MKTNLALATLMLAGSSLAAPAVTTAHASASAPEMRAAGQTHHITTRYGRGRRIRIGNKQQPFKSSQKTVTVTGTVSFTESQGGVPGSYSLKGDDGKTYKLLGHEADLKFLTNKKAEITGTTSSGSGVNTIRVHTVKASFKT